MTQYFKKFPTINYNGSPAINLMTSVNMTKLTLNSLQTYYDYVAQDLSRPDNLSYDYYGNPDYIWLIGLANQVIDPYYDLPITDEELIQLIINKYGSMHYAQNAIKYFETNWATDDSVISPNYYNQLPAGQKKYWSPNIDNNNSIYEYVRKQESLFVSTNAVQQLNISYSYTNTLYSENNYLLNTEDNYDLYGADSNSYIAFLPGEFVKQNEKIIGTVVYADANSLTIQHLSGQSVFDALGEHGVYGATFGTITGTISNAIATVITIPDSTYNIPLAVSNIPYDELIYWNAVTLYDYETAKNTANKTLKLLDNRYATQATQQLKDLLLT
jgi:hypothetical protein